MSIVIINHNNAPDIIIYIKCHQYKMVYKKHNSLRNLYRRGGWFCSEFQHEHIYMSYYSFLEVGVLLNSRLFLSVDGSRWMIVPILVSISFQIVFMHAIVSNGINNCNINLASHSQTLFIIYLTLNLYWKMSQSAENIMMKRIITCNNNMFWFL